MSSPFLTWTDFDDRRLRSLVLAMFSFPKIEAEFPGHSVSALRVAWDRLFYQDGMSPLDRAMYVLGPRAKYSPNCATGLRLDHQPAGAAEIVEAANVVLDQRKLPRIGYIDADLR